MIGHHFLEADDIIAIYTNTIFDTRDAHITIITNDNDYIQLLTHPRIQKKDSSLLIKNLQDKNLQDRLPYTPEQFIKIKKIMGDKSDNIPPITSKCGDKTALKYATNPDLLQKLFQSNPVAKAQYELNELLTDFSFIPRHLRKEIEKTLVFEDDI